MRQTLFYYLKKNLKIVYILSLTINQNIIMVNMIDIIVSDIPCIREL
jgi:hypothetical protein